MEKQNKISNGVKISVVIPAYNEEKVIISTLKEIKNFLAERFGSDFEIIVVDDKSSDSTLDFVSNFSGIKVLRNLKNHGKGYSVTKGVRAATGDWILFMDADNSTRIIELDNFFRHSSEYKFLIASRALKGSRVEISQNIIKVLFGKFGNLVSRLLIHPDIRDTQCGFKLFSSELKFLFDKLTIDDFAFDFELIFLARKYKFSIKEIPISWYNNFDSSVRWFNYPKTMLDIFKIRINNLIGKYN